MSEWKIILVLLGIFHLCIQDYYPFYIEELGKKSNHGNKYSLGTTAAFIIS